MKLKEPFIYGFCSRFVLDPRLDPGSKNYNSTN
jgi:hypothetical protein